MSALTAYLEPFQFSRVVMEPPRRQSFSVYSFNGFREAVRLLQHFRKNPSWLKAERLYNQALKEHSVGNYREAERYYRACTQTLPEHEPAHVNLAAVYVHQNDFVQAERELRMAIHVRPNYFRAHYDLGLILAHRDLGDEALACFEQAMLLKPDHFWTYVAAAEIHMNRSEHGEAVRCYQKALTCTKDRHPVLVRLAEVYYLERDFANAELALKDASLTNSTPEIVYNLAWLIAVQGEDFAKAAELFGEAESLRRGFKAAKFNLTLAQCAASQYAEAVETARHYVALYFENRAEEHLRMLDLLIKIQPRNVTAYMKSSEWLLSQGKVTEAVAMLEKLLNLDPENVEGLESLGALYTNLGKPKEAIQTYRRLVTLVPNHVGGYLGLAKAFGAIENYSAAIPVLKRVLELDPSDSEVHYQYGTLMAQQGDFKTAFEHYKRVQALNPKFPRIERRLKMLEEEVKDQEAETPQPWPPRRPGTGSEES